MGSAKPQGGAANKLFRHIAKETGQFACPERDCPVKSGSKDDLDRHLREKHQQGKNNEPVQSYVCGVIGCKRYSKVFPRTHNLLEHYKKIHPGHGEVFLKRDPLTGLIRGSNVPVSDQSSSSSPSAPLEDPFPNIGAFLVEGAFDFQFNGRAQNDHDLSAAPGLQQTPNNGFGYFDNIAGGPGSLPAGSDDISQGQDRYQFAQDAGGDGGQVEIQRRISTLLDERHRALQKAQETEEKIVALRRALEVMKE
ncbi:hypothetical protein MMC30_000211 [Trapelia coarctata]|nr:hypothetical protein [Trapelia coarctata]